VLSAVVLCEEYDFLRPDPGLGKGISPSERLVRTLGSLVRANIEGLLRDVAIAGPEGRGLDVIADYAGCALVVAGSERDWLQLAIEAARGPKILILRSGHAPEVGFIEEAGDFLRSGGSVAALHAVPEKFLERLFPNLAPLAGLIAPRELCLKSPPQSFAKVAHHCGKATVLSARARRVG
jgi:hypothetical protein